MRLSLIGMSGCGKTYWSREFSRHGFKLFCCDDLISEKLQSVLTKPDGTVQDLGEWMGFPYDFQYEDREKQYLDLEIAVMQDIITYLKQNQNADDANIIVDTTGSVIYTGESNLKTLQEKTTVVYLETPPEIQALMLEKYLKNKRPVLWRGLFRQQQGETKDEALARCYPALLSSREKLYTHYAHVIIDYRQRTRDDFGIETFIQLVT
jgi:shikimate kinase